VLVPYVGRLARATHAATLVEAFPRAAYGDPLMNRPIHIAILTEESPRCATMVAVLRAAGFDVAVHRPVPGAREPDADLVLVDAALPPAPLAVAERRHIAATLRHTQGNRRLAAHLLGIARSTLLSKIRKYGIQSVGPADGHAAVQDLAS
jgi:hypothetical protein